LQLFIKTLEKKLPLEIESFMACLAALLRACCASGVEALLMERVFDALALGIKKKSSGNSQKDKRKKGSGSARVESAPHMLN
jgi:hypothetical protein